MGDVKAYRQDYSDATGQAYPRRNLVLSKRKYQQLQGENYLLYSSYNSSFWTVDTASDAGTVSAGCYLDKNRCRVNLDNTVTELGEQTWQGTGVFRSSTATSLTGWTTLYFSFEFGGYYQSTTQTFTVKAGLCAAGGAGKQEVLSLTVTAPRRLKFNLPIASITATPVAACYFYVSVTPSVATGKWYIIDAQLEKDKATPGVFVPATGAAVSHTSKQVRTVAKIHPTEWEFVQETWDGIWPPREGQDQSSYTTETGDL